jgi:hypothetical protein
MPPPCTTRLASQPAIPPTMIQTNRLINIT